MSADAKPSAWARRYGRVPKRERRYISREERAELFEERRRAKAARIARRDRQCDTPLLFPIEQDVYQQAIYDDHHAQVETRIARERRHAAVRELNARALERAADWLNWNPRAPLPPGQVSKRYDAEQLHRDAERLLRARKLGHWGINTYTGDRVIRYFDRSGLPLLDPSEANRNAARIARRLIPVLLRYANAGAHLYYAVASETNVPLGRLEWGKRHLFDRVRRLYDAFPEIMGVFACQEDPLSRDLQSWNVHINLLLVVNPRLCTRLTDRVAKQLSLRLVGHDVVPLEAARPVDRTPPGFLSYAKIHHAWGREQFHFAWLQKPTEESLRWTLLELIKYSAKMASKEAIDRAADAAVGADDPAQSHRMGQGESDFRSPCLDLRGDDAVGPGPDRGQLLRLVPSNDEGAPRRLRRRNSPGLAEYHPRELIEYLEANRRFRRARTWGVLYGIEDDDHEDPDRKGHIRWLGRIYISPSRATVEEAPLQFVSSIHGDKSGGDFSAATGRGLHAQARAGPATGAAMP